MSYRPTDSMGREVRIGDVVRYDGKEWVVCDFEPPTGDERVGKYLLSDNHANTWADEIAVDLVRVGTKGE